MKLGEFTVWDVTHWNPPSNLKGFGAKGEDNLILLFGKESRNKTPNLYFPSDFHVYHSYSFTTDDNKNSLRPDVYRTSPCYIIVI